MVNTLYFLLLRYKLKEKKDKTNYFFIFFQKEYCLSKNNHFSSIQNYKYREKAPKNRQKQLV